MVDDRMSIIGWVLVAAIGSVAAMLVLLLDDWAQNGSGPDNDPEPGDNSS